MASPTARGGRRRRVLNEEVLNSTTLMFCNSLDSKATDASPQRYGEQANIEHHPQITDFVPRRPRALVLLGIAGIGAAVGAQLLAQCAADISSQNDPTSTSLLVQRLADGLVAWVSSTYLLLAAVAARILYGLRRHRIDDYRGNYRVWRWAAWGAVLASVNSVVQGHELVAVVASSATGWRLSSSGVEWWLIPLGILGGWIGVRATLEASESRGALAMAVCAWTSYAIAVCGALQWIPASWSWFDAGMGTILLVGHTFLLAALALFARYVVLDVQGLIDHPGLVIERPATESSVAPSASSAVGPELKGTSARADAAHAPSGAMTADARRNDSLSRGDRGPAQNRASAPADEHEEEVDETAWVDGSEPVADHDGDWQLSKSDRKRLRKEKVRRRAA